MAIRSTLVLALIIGIVGAVAVPEENPKALGVGWSSSNLTLVPKTAKTSEKHPTHASNSILLFCGAKRARGDDNYLEIDRVEWLKFSNPDSTNVAEAEEVKEFESLGPTSNNTVSLNISNPFVNASGKYRCKLWKGSILMAINDFVVNMRPVFIQEDNQPLDVKKEKPFGPFNLYGGGRTVTEGEDVTLSCRALGNPEPKYHWERDGKPLKTGERLSIEKNVLKITGVTEQDRNSYKCIASNSDEVESYESSVTFILRVKSGQMAWVWPLLAIIVTAVLLAVIIMSCEYRRKKSEREAQVLVPEEED